MATESSRLERGRISAKTHRLKKKNEIINMRETLSAQKVRIDQLEIQAEKLQQQNDYLTNHVEWLNGGASGNTNEALIQIEQHVKILVEKNKVIAELEEKVTKLEANLETLKKRKNNPQKRLPSISVEAPPELSVEDRVVSELRLENAKLKKSNVVMKVKSIADQAIFPIENRPGPSSRREEYKARSALFPLPNLSAGFYHDNTKHERLYSFSECSSNSNKTIDYHDRIDEYDEELARPRANSNESKFLCMSTCNSTDTLPLQASKPLNPLFPSKFQRKRSISSSEYPYMMEDMDRPEKRRLDRDLLKRAPHFVQNPIERDSTDPYWEQDKDEWPSYR